MACVAQVLLAYGVANANHIVNCASYPCLGTDGEDVIRGIGARDTKRALPGDDLVKGFAATM